jgi:hypothetical protein
MPDTTGPGTTEISLEQAGHRPMPAAALLARIADHTVWGDYLFGYRFVSYCSADGHIEGTNNAGSYNTGHWHIDPAANTFSVTWNQTWVPATLRAYQIGDTLHFFDQSTGLWHMSFNTCTPGKQPLTLGG